MSKKTIYTSNEAAKALGLAPRQINKLFDAGRLRGYRIPGSCDRRIPLECLIRYCRENGIQCDILAPEADENTPPQRFRWRVNGVGRWRFGACVYAASFEVWHIHTFGHSDIAMFDRDPWEVLGQVVGDVGHFEWIDNDMGWKSDESCRESFGE